jgi:RimJ/RimL family protein N-acetyltransferase
MTQSASQPLYLRPVRESELDLVEALYDDPVEASEYGFYGYRNPGGLRRSWAEPDGIIGLDRGSLVVVRTGGPAEEETVVGEVGWHKVVHGPTSFCWNIGIGLFAKERGKGYGTEAQRLLARYLFAHTQVNRVEAATESSNIGEQRALEKAGFTREGVERGSCFRMGHWRDMVVYSILRSEVTL